MWFAPVFLGECVLKGEHMRWHSKLNPMLSRWIIEKKAPRTRRVRLYLEELETRALLSASSVTAIAPTSALSNVTAQTNTTTIAPAASSTFSGYTPSQLRAAYGVPSTINGSPAGTGETIAIVDAYNDPNIAKDLATFSAKYGLPAANLTVVNENGSQTSLPANNSSWAVEESLDVEWAHAIAPGAKIVLVEASSTSLSDLLTAVSTATSKEGANVVSMSWGAGEFNGETSYDKYFTAPGVTYVASAGDSSAYVGPEWPASSPNVLAVGGSTLSLTSSNTISSETAWSATYSWYYGYEGGGGGISSYEPAPSFQSNIPVAQEYDARTTPDVAWDANPSTGVSIYDSYGEPGWGYVGGTSAGAPAWAGIAAIADQNSGQSLSTAQVENALYGAYNNSSTYNSVFNDIKNGSNGYAATTGYDLATGLGSPKVSALISTLFPAPLALASSTTNATTEGTTTTTTHQRTESTSGHLLVLLETIEATSAPSTLSIVGSAASNAPAGMQTSSSLGGSTSAFNTLASFTQSVGQPSMSLSGGSSLVAGSENASLPQSSGVFGASGWNGSIPSLRLGSFGLSGPALDQLGAIPPGDGEDDGDIPSSSDAGNGDAAGELDWLLFDSAPLGLFEGEVSDGADSGDGSAGGE